MNKILFIFVIYSLIIPIAAGQNWYKIEVYKNDLRVYIDIDSISNKSKDLIEYKIKYEDLSKNTNKILYTESNCIKNLAALKTSQKSTAELKSFASTSPIGYIHNYACSFEELPKKLNWGPYMRDLEQRIKRNWQPPKGDTSKRVVVTFSIAKDGRLLIKKVVKSSGFPLADQAAIRAIETTAPFRPLPPEFKGNSVPIEFTFDYNVVNSILR